MNKKRIAIISIATILLFALFLMIATFISDTSLPGTVENLHEQVMNIIEGETIKGVFCAPGTYDKIVVAASEISEEAEARVVDAVNLYFNEMIGKTDDYLDWYYSMGGQWSQIGTAVKGVFKGSVSDAVSSYMQEKLTITLDPGIDLNGSISSILDEAKTTLAAVSDAIISENRIQQTQGNEYVVTINVTMEDIAQNAALNIGLDPVRTNAGGIVAGIVSGVIVKKIVSKVMSKAVTKLAVNSATKILTPAVVGSAAGPIGTVAGALVGVGVDFLTNKADEALNRSDYKAEIISCIEEERDSILNEVAVSFDTMA